MDHTIQKDWKSVWVTRSFLPLGKTIVKHSEAFIDQKKKCYDKMGLIPMRIVVPYLEINAFPMGKSLFSCHIERILPPPVITLSWFDPKCNRMENQCIPYGS